MYDIEYGIAKYHDLIKNPLLKVSAHPTEDIESDSRFEVAFKRYVESDVYALTGIPFDKAIEMPTYQFSRLCSLAREVSKKRSNISKDVINDAAKAAGLPGIK